MILSSFVSTNKTSIFLYFQIPWSSSDHKENHGWNDQHSRVSHSKIYASTIQSPICPNRDITDKATECVRLLYHSVSGVFSSALKIYLGQWTGTPHKHCGTIAVQTLLLYLLCLEYICMYVYGYYGAKVRNDIGFPFGKPPLKMGFAEFFHVYWMETKNLCFWWSLVLQGFWQPMLKPSAMPQQ